MSEINWKWTFWNRELSFSWRDKKGWGRFGAGWQWAVGVQMGPSSILFNCLVCQIKFSKRWEASNQ